MAQKTEIPGLYKVSEGILINKDDDSLKSYKARRAREMKMDLLEKKVSKIENDLDEIKTLLRGIANK